MAAPAIRRAASTVAALLLALCAGAVWSVVALLVRGDAPFMAAPTAIVVVYALDYLKLPRGGARAAGALLLYAAAIVYAHYLNAASIVAAQLGVSFVDALVRVGPEMAYALATARGNGVDLAILVAIGALLAGYVARKA